MIVQSLKLFSPVTQMSLLRDPTQPGVHREKDDSYIEGLIEKNVAGKYDRDYLIGLEIRTLFHSLSDINKKKFIKVVKAFELDKKNLKYFIGEIWSGGGMRVIAGSGTGSVMNAIALLTGMKFKNFLGASAGSFQALSRHLNCLNSTNINTTIEAPFKTFPQHRENLGQWVDGWSRDSYKNTTGRDNEGPITGKQLAEFDSRFDVIVGERSNHRFPLNAIYPDIFWLFQSAENKYGLSPKDISVPSALEATANLTGLFHHPFDPTFGNCVMKDKDGNEHYHFDPGLNSTHRTPLEPQIEEIEKYKLTGEKPGIFFVFDYQNVNRHDRKKLKQQGGEFVKGAQSNIGKVVDTAIWAHDVYESFLDRDPEIRMSKIGTNRAFIKANCATIDPNTGKIVMLDTGRLTTPLEERETIIAASIPTSDFKDIENSVIEQLYDNFVDESYIDTDGQSGKSAYELILSDIDKALGINNNKESQPLLIWAAMQCFNKAAAM